jgi:hypothetical protein
MPIGGGKFTLEKTWHSAAPSTTTLNASGNFTVPYGKYDISIYGYGGSALVGNVSGYNDYYYSVYVPASPPYYTGQVNVATSVAAYYNINEYGSNPAPPTYQTWSYPPNINNACPIASSYHYPSYYGYHTPGGPGWTVYVNYSCSPVSNPNPAYTYYVLVPGNPNYNPSTPASPSDAMGVTIPGSTNVTAPSAVKVNYRNYPDSATYPATVSYGGQLVIQYR